MAADATLDRARQAIAAAVSPANFFVGPGLDLEWRHGSGEQSWEIFQGRLLDATQTRERRAFETWDIGPVGTGEALLSAKLDPAAGQVHVTRAIHCYVWEGYDGGGNVFLSRETTRWVREMVATLAVADPVALRSGLSDALFRAVVGTSRLPLTSLEAPLPAFTLGQLAYFPRTSGEPAAPMRSVADLLDCDFARRALEQVKLLETLLRATPVQELAPLAGGLLAQPDAAACWPVRLRGLFDEVSLSPYTDFVDKTLAFVRILADRGGLSAADHVDFCGFLLRHLARHLTAYDLVQFHHMGANYPDALLLDAVLKRYLELAEEFPALFAAATDQGRLRRRALRQGWLLRRLYEGHPVPAAPTSPGENSRVLPPAFPRVPEEHITMPHRRPRQLYADDPLHAGPSGQEILRQSVADLANPAELRELGTALFIDRPLSTTQAGEPDTSLLFSHVCFSRYLAGRRLDLLARLELMPDQGELALRRQELASMPVQGLTISPPRGPGVPGRVALTDAIRVADDFQLLHTTRRAVTDFLACYPLTGIEPGHRLLIVRDPESDRVHIHDSEGRQRLELQLGLVPGAANPALRVVRWWDELGNETSSSSVWMRACEGV